MLGLIPGFGAGHFYAGDPETGKKLLVIELVGASMLGISVIHAIGEILLEILTFGGYDSGGNDETLEKIAIAGAVVMGGCILYDALHAPAAAVRRNRQVRNISAAATPFGASVSIHF